MCGFYRRPEVFVVEPRLPWISLVFRSDYYDDYNDGPENPSRRIRQKCTAIRMLATSGMKMQWRM
jgi:hypothetical protein